MERIIGRAHAESVTVGSTATLLNGVAPTRLLSPRLRLTVANGSTVVYLGGPNVTTATGIPLAANEKYTIDAADGVYAVTATTATVNILEGF